MNLIIIGDGVKVTKAMHDHAFALMERLHASCTGIVSATVRFRVLREKVTDKPHLAHVLITHNEAAPISLERRGDCAYKIMGELAQMAKNVLMRKKSKLKTPRRERRERHSERPMA